MNRHLYRLVFNRARNKLIAVQETASSVSSGSQGQTSGGSAGSRGSLGILALPLRRIAWAALCACGMSTGLPIALAQTTPTAIAKPATRLAVTDTSSSIAPASVLLTASPGAPAGQRPIIDAASNGVPIVHIAAPSAAGVSVNKFQDFNVGRQGLIENNSASSVQTQLGGWIAGNPQLGYVPARIIVNEVTGTNLSVLKGTIEIAGRRADLVISNVNGLAIDGLGFINTGRATLTTGTPQYSAQGGLQGLSVTQGQMSVGSGGLNAVSLEQLDLMARGFVIEGEVWAQRLNVLAGANQVPYADLGVQPGANAQAGSGTAPRFAIDIKDLGGMFANQVFLVATEQGLGVNSTGRVAALQGNLHLSANGDLTLKDTYAAQSIAIVSSGNVSLNGQTQTPTPTDGSAPGDIAIVAAGTLRNAGNLDAAGSVALSAAALRNTGTLIQRNDASPMTLSASTDVVNSGVVYSATDLAIRSKAFADLNGSLQSLGSLNVTAQSLSLEGTQASSANALKLTATSGDLTARDAQLVAGTDAALSASGRLDMTNGLLQAQSRSERRRCRYDDRPDRLAWHWECRAEHIRSAPHQPGWKCQCRRRVDDPGERRGQRWRIDDRGRRCADRLWRIEQRCGHHRLDDNHIDRRAAREQSRRRHHLSTRHPAIASEPG